MTALTRQQLTMVNGKFVDCVSTYDRGIAYGDGVFETMRCRDGRIPLLPFHLERLQQGCCRLQIPLDLIAVSEAIQRFINSQSVAAVSKCTAAIKLVVTRGIGGQGYQPQPAREVSTTVVLQAKALSDTPVITCAGVELRECSRRIFPNPHLAGIKHLNRLDYVLAGLELPQTQDVQGLLLDEDDQLLEALHHNLFLIASGELLTPALLNSGVHGVMRRIILEKIAPELQMTFHETGLDTADLLRADEVFLCNSVRGVVPVGSFRERRWQTPGPVTALLQKRVDAFRDGLDCRGGE